MALCSRCRTRKWQMLLVPPARLKRTCLIKRANWYTTVLLMIIPEQCCCRNRLHLQTAIDEMLSGKELPFPLPVLSDVAIKRKS